MLCLWDFGPIRGLGALVGSCWLVAKALGAYPSSHFLGWWRIVNDYKALKMYMLVSFQYHLKTLNYQKQDTSDFDFCSSQTLRVKLESCFHVCIGANFPFPYSSELFLSTHHVKVAMWGALGKGKSLPVELERIYQLKRLWHKGTEKGGWHRSSISLKLNCLTVPRPQTLVWLHMMIHHVS